MDYRDADSLYTDEQLGSSHDQEFETSIENRLKDVHTCLPGIIKSYDPVTNTAVVQPAYQITFIDGPKDFPILGDVPVYFPGGGGYSMTFPVHPGDECLLIFSERCINYWHITGEVKPGEVFRLHDPSDAFALPGIRSQPRRLANIQTDGIELRADDRSTYIKLNAGGIEIKGSVTVIDGTVTANDFQTSPTLKFSTHLHPSGTPNTGAPIPPP